MLNVILVRRTDYDAVYATAPGRRATCRPALASIHPVRPKILLLAGRDMAKVRLYVKHKPNKKCQQVCPYIMLYKKRL